MYMRTGEVPKDRRGAHFKIHSAIDDKQIQQGVLTLLKEKCKEFAAASGCDKPGKRNRESAAAAG